MIARLCGVALGFLMASASFGASQPSFGNPVTNGIVTAYQIWESSGIIVSRQNPGVVWTHNDSGYAGSVFALCTNGTLLARWALPNVFSGDFEDISFGPGPNPAYDYIYLGDIGDNYLTRSSITVYRFPEPAVYAFQSNAPVEATIPKWDAITLTYPDGVYNAEGMLVDPRTGDLFIFTKLDASSRIYRATRAELDGGQPILLTFMTEITFKKVSGADISRDGSLIALRRGGTATLWVRDPGQTVDQAVTGRAISLPLAVEPNGEAIGFTPDADGYYTLSEGSSQPLYFYPRTDSTPAHPRVFVEAGGTWLYDAMGVGAADGWMMPAFDDGYFATGAAPLGYGSGEATTLDFGPSDAKTITTYLRQHFPVASTNGLTNLALRVSFNDGIAVHLNGTEIMRRNLPRGAQYDTLATASNSDYRSIWRSVAVNPALLHTGTNVLAVELHRADATGNTLNFDLQLASARLETPPQFTTLPVLSAGMCTIHVIGPVGSVAHVVSSTDLTNWTAAGDVPLPNGAGNFQQSAGSEVSFYRVVEW